MLMPQKRRKSPTRKQAFVISESPLTQSCKSTKKVEKKAFESEKNLIKHAVTQQIEKTLTASGGDLRKVKESGH